MFNNIPSVSTADTTYKVASITVSSSDNRAKAVFGNPAEDVEKRNAKIKKEIKNNQKEILVLEEKLKYLKGDPELIAQKQKKQEKTEAVAGIIGGVIGVGGTLAITIPSFATSASVGTVGLGAVLGVTVTPLIIGGILALGTALAVAKINSNNNKKEEASKENEIVQLEKEIENLQLKIKQTEAEIVL